MKILFLLIYAFYVYIAFISEFFFFIKWWVNDTCIYVTGNEDE